MVRDIGLHLRLMNSLYELAQRARELEIPLFQCFLVQKTTGAIIQPTQEDIKHFLTLRHHFNAIYIHGSYWINLAGVIDTAHYALYRELRLAKKLHATHMILHPGFAKGTHDKHKGIELLARVLNKLLQQEHDIKIVLENSAHGGLSVGGDVADFGYLLTKLDHPEKIVFCIDTAHAYCYGYDIANDQIRQDYIALLAQTIGIDAIALLHVNDTNQRLGSKMDQHAVVGAGNIGIEALKSFVLDERMRGIPMLMELPVVSHEQEKDVLEMVRRWH